MGDIISAMREIRWSPSEKAIVKKAFDWALNRELQATIDVTKRMAQAIKRPADLWQLEQFLRDRRKEIDREFDYRYSVLPLVFAKLIREGKLSHEHLQGLSEDKFTLIRQLTRD
jgi:plasmid stabilization system protein ParE